MEDAVRCYVHGWRVTPVDGKRPYLEGWPERRIDPSQVKSQDGWGVILGRGSGVIDVECDSPEAYEHLLELTEGEVPMTVCWRSDRGMHFIFKWTEGWPDKAVIKYRGVEIRLGNRPAQSVLPPSGNRRWVTAPWEGKVAEFVWMDRVLAADAVVGEVDYMLGEPLDVQRWLDRHRVKVYFAKVLDGCHRWYIECPNCGAHTTPNHETDCMIVQDATGKLGAKCFHQSCGMSDWQQVKSAIGAPDWMDYHDEEKSRHWGEVAARLWPSKFVQFADEDEDNESDFCEAMIPQEGLIRAVYEYYREVAYMPSPIFGLATSLSLCQTIFGRRIATHTGLRTNDYHVVLATTGSGKEACETTVTRILEAADPALKTMMPADVQSGNGLINALCVHPLRIWVCDEFGKILQSVLDKKGNQHLKNIGTHLLKLYGKSGGRYTGAAHSDKIRNAIVQPHLSVLGLATQGTVFASISADQLVDGLLGRIAFWPVMDRPEANEDLMDSDPSEHLTNWVKSWLEFQPGGNLASEYPQPVKLAISGEAKDRWNSHAREIRRRMDSESEVRAAVWARVAARSLKLALTHCAAQLGEAEHIAKVKLEVADINWGVKLSNWLARIACGIVCQTMPDLGLSKAKEALLRALAESDQVSSRQILRANRTLTQGDVAAAAESLGIRKKTILTGGRPRLYYCR